MRIATGLLAFLLPVAAFGQGVAPPGGYPGPNPNLSYTTGLFALGPRVMAFGDDEANANALNAFNNNGLSGGAQEIQYGSNGIVPWVNRFSRRALTFDVTQGYGPIQYAGGVEKVEIPPGSGGNYSVAPTAATLTGCSTTTLGAPVMAGTAVSFVPVTGETGPCPTGSALVLTGGTGTAATGYALSGNGGTISAVGATTQNMVDMLPDIVNLPVDIVFVSGGANGIVAGTETPSTVIANLTTVFTRIMASGKSVVFFSLDPYSQIAGVPTTSQQKALWFVDTWAQSWIAGQADIRAAGNGNIRFLTRYPECLDKTSATASMLASCTTGSHLESGGGAYTIGYKTAQVLAPLLGAFGSSYVTSGAQTHDATYNPGGLLSGSSWLNAVTGGTLAAPFTGTCPSGWYCSRYFGSGTGTIAAGSTESPRSDLLSGSRYQVTSSLGAGVGTTQIAIGTTQTVATLAITPGTSPIYGQVALEVSNEVNLKNIDLLVSCQNSSSTVLAQADDLAGGYTDGSVWPASTALYGPTTALEMVLLTPPVVCPAAATQVQFAIVWAYADGGAAASATGTLKFTDAFMAIKQ